MHIWFSYYLSAIGIQCIFLTHQQGAYETRVGVSDWITGGEVQVGNTGWVTFRWSLLQLPPVGERFTWLNLISFPLYTYNILLYLFISLGQNKPFDWHISQMCKISLTVLIKDTLKGFVVLKTMWLDAVDSVSLVHKHHLKGVSNLSPQNWTYSHHNVNVSERFRSNSWNTFYLTKVENVIYVINLHEEAYPKCLDESQHWFAFSLKWNSYLYILCTPLSNTFHQVGHHPSRRTLLKS